MSRKNTAPLPNSAEAGGHYAANPKAEGRPRRAKRAAASSPTGVLREDAASYGSAQPNESAVPADVSSRPTASGRAPAEKSAARSRAQPRPSALVDTRVIYCGDCLEQLRNLPERCVDLIYIDPPFNSNRNYEVFWGETREKRAFEDRNGNTTRTLTCRAD